MKIRNRLLPVIALLAVAILFAGCGKRVGPGGVIDDPDAERTITHVVTEGESLAEIADNYYGDPARVDLIVAANGLGDPARVEPGSTLELYFDGSQWALARRRAAAMAPYNRGVAYLAEEHVKRAEEEFGRALEIAPDFVGARYNLALTNIKIGRHDAADRLLADLVSERPEAEDIAFAYGHVLFLQTRFAESVDVFSDLLARSPAHQRAAFGLARALQETGRTADATAAWEDYLALDADSSWADLARRNLAELRGE